LYILHNYTRIKLERFTWERRCSCWIIWCCWLFQVCVVLHIFMGAMHYVMSDYIKDVNSIVFIRCSYCL